MKYFSIFGAGELGRKVLKEWNSNEIHYFIDNDDKKWGMKIAGIQVIGLDALKKMELEDTIIIPYGRYTLEVRKQLLENGIEKVKIYQAIRTDNKEFVINPYEKETHISFDAALSDEGRALNNAYAEQLAAQKALFESIEIETINRCNGLCGFCPVSIRNDLRKETLMDMQLFYKIINELKEINYDKLVSLFSNNEPFLDKRIIEMHKFAKKQLPNAYFNLFTNGTLLTLEKFIEIIPYVDSMIIDNYSDNLQLISNVERIKEYCMEHAELQKKVTIVIRKQHEVLTSRGGDAPNVTLRRTYGEDKCILPFEQIVVRPDGKVSLCCNDPLGKLTMGDLNKQTLLEVWKGDRYAQIREKILKGRKNIPKCEACDVFYL